jgi:HK97 family phage major capsid protein
MKLYRDLKAGGYFSETSTIPSMALPLEYSLLSLKTLVLGNSASSAGSVVLNDFIPGIVDLLQRPRTFLDLLSRVRTSSDTIDWVKQTAFTNAATTVAEATSTTGTSGVKPESALDWVRTQVPIQVIATWIPITTRALADAPMMQDIINGQIITMLELALEAQVLTGGGTGSDLTGILNQGILTQALGTDNTMDAIFKAAIKIQVSGQLAATDIVMNPLNFQTLRLLRENVATGTLGQYLMGPPSQGGTPTIFGLPITLSQGLTANTVLVGAFNPATHALFDREQANIRTGYIDQQFVRNMLTILGELRAGLVVTRPFGFCSITGVS